MRWRRPRREAAKQGTTAAPAAVDAVPPAPAGLPCRAPRTSLAFDPLGHVRPCYRSDYTYGRVGTASLRSIWEGAPRADLVAAVDRADLSLGCTHCKWQTEIGTAHLAFARRYDDLALDGPGLWPRQLEFALSNTCNLQCAQCTGMFSSAIRSRREHLPPIESPYDDRFFEELTPFLDQVEIVRFTGGEPFLSRSTQRVWDLMLASPNRPACTMVTNATQWNDRVERVLDELGFQVTVSLDAIDHDTLRATRVGIDPVQVFANVERFSEAARRNGTSLGLSYCMMTTTWQEFGAVIRFADERDMAVDCSVVTSPHELSLHRLSRSELSDIVAHLEREDAQIGPHLGRNREVWTSELDRLRADLARPESDPGLALSSVEVELQRFRGDHPEVAMAEPRVSLGTVFAATGTDADGGAVGGAGGGLPDPEADRRLLASWMGASSLAILVGTVVDDVVIELSAGAGTDWLGVTGLAGLFIWSARERILERVGPGGASNVIERTPTRLDEVTRHVLRGVSVDLRSIIVRDGSDAAGAPIRTMLACRPVVPDDPSAAAGPLAPS